MSADAFANVSLPLLLDGGFGTQIQQAGLPPGKDPADWNVENPAAVAAVHRAYAAAGARIVLTNTFGANRLKYRGVHPLGELVAAAVRIAKDAGAGGETPPRVALDVGPTGRLLKPSGDLDFEDAYAAFAELVRQGAAAGADLVFVETMGDLRELKAAVLAAKESCGLPVFATVALGEDGQLLTGGGVEEVAALLEGLGADAYGLNCGLSPDRMLPFVERLARVSTRPLIVKPNAGMPQLGGGRAAFAVGPEEFAGHVGRLVAAGATVLGGCCGTTPDHVRALAGLRVPAVPRPAPAPRTVVSSGSLSVELRPGAGLIVGERINPTGKKLLREALVKGDVAYVLREAVRQTEAGAAVLDVNCGVPGIDEAETLARTVEAVQSVTAAPIQIDTGSPAALARALRAVNGRPLVNSVNGSRASMDAVFPLVRRHGGVMVALCLDEGGIPPTAEGRLAIARRILAEGARYGFTAADFVVDALTLAVSADPQAAVVTLETVRRLTEDLGVNTILGVSNVSFGLPDRPALNSALYTLAKRAGLSAAIANPALVRETDDPAAFDVLLGRDPNCARWIARSAAADAAGKDAAPSAAAAQPAAAALCACVEHGLREDARAAAEAAIRAGRAPLEVIDGEIVPALERVGRGFEAGKAFLPQLLMAADAASAAFEVVRRALAAQGGDAKKKGPVILATVKGDVHDIGKNIVRALLENYGFDVIDLGRDVPPGRVVEAALKNRCRLVGLSALMTTTLPAMEETIRRLREADPEIRTLVGGAVLTEDYARSIGATWYAKDAMATVRIAEKNSGIFSASS